MDVINQSKILEDSDLIRILSAINKALPELCQAWNKPLIQTNLAKRTKKSWINISDCLNPPMYGYHSVINGHPIGRAYITNSDLNLSSKIISHEIFEMIVNPYLEVRSGYQLEVCDPVMNNTFEIDGIVLSDWIYPSWFCETGLKPFNKLDTLIKPFEVSEGGYTLKMNLSSRC
jgi:hypothetical protein